ncbi:hypothetical protein ACCO45_004904 [Purpureocillium lilacinum]|uniref:Uncharacterized protein n=1 Tax=Purpureocillium lilacinum TaxID=33203 RepID=A0ACC4DUK8_PURLI
MPPHGTAALCLQPSTVHPSVHPSPDITRQFSCPLRLLPPVLLFLKPSTLLRHPRSSRFAKRLSTGHSRRPATIESYRFVVEALPQHSFLSCPTALH